MRGCTDLSLRCHDAECSLLIKHVQPSTLVKVTVIQNHRPIRVPPILFTHDEILIQTKSDFWRERRKREGRMRGREGGGRKREREGRREGGKRERRRRERGRRGGGEERGRKGEGGRREGRGERGEEKERGREEEANIPADPARKLFI